MLHTGRSGGLQGGLVLGQAAARAVQRVGADQQQALRTGEGGGQAGRLVEVGRAHDDALGGQRRQGLGPSGGGDQAAGGHVQRVQQVVDDALAEVAGGAGDEQGV